MTTGPSAMHLDLGVKESLLFLIRPEMRGAIEPWMSKAGESEKRGVLRLARMANPNLLAPHEKPRKAGQIPSCAVQKGQYINPLTNTASNFLQKSSSSPYF
mmetsp:Transcript_3561/g.5744  ORF Transcript_3561/g.5744 Transcript_3561/m.5744 type:complete len:101 (-) Transcript_3561:95-397(-)|eukprot:CAMPEP_0169072676 /NCGR_PEP_ID=MMETSP1015-20121227/6329_1 /TAXON_ID=342587 /ORGANISM="Karlodinium micrum, Strain CCMP2283" /LENGTH=100 /DNA_ID=CAMNT_0009131863 /DNA_START=62 /DNA_END=364 /DNA_ORIENTATION=+